MQAPWPQCIKDLCRDFAQRFSYWLTDAYQNKKKNATVVVFLILGFLILKTFCWFRLWTDLQIWHLGNMRNVRSSNHFQSHFIKLFVQHNLILYKGQKKVSSQRSQKHEERCKKTRLKIKFLSFMSPFSIVYFLHKEQK